MPTIRLTETSIARIKAPNPQGRQVLYWDKNLKGFGVLASGKTNAKSYVVQQALPGGRTRRVTVGRINALTLETATARAKELLAAFYRGIDPKASRRGEATLRSALDDYLRTRSDLRPRSAASYRDTVENHLDCWLDRPLRDVTRDMVEDQLRKIAKGVSKGTGNATANGTMRSLRAIYNFAADRAPQTNPMPPNPVRLKKLWLPVKPRTRHLSTDELPKFYEAVMALPNAIHRDFLLLIVFTGLRRREAAALKWSEVDFGSKLIKLPGVRTKAGRALDLPMSDVVHSLLVARRALGDTTWVFPSNSKSGHFEEPKFPLRAVTATTGIKVSALIWM